MKIKALSMKTVLYDRVGKEWRVSQRYEKNGRERTVVGFGWDRTIALDDFEREKKYLEEEQDYTWKQFLADFLEPFELTIRAIKALFGKEKK